MEEGPMLIEELKETLKAHAVTKVVDGKKVVSSQITHQLSQHGVVLVTIPDDVSRVVAAESGNHMADSFEKFSPNTKTDLRAGRFGSYSKEWKKSGSYETTEVSGKSNGMANQPPLDPELRDDFSTKLDGNTTVHVPNKVNATNNISTWEHLSAFNPELEPSKWVVEPLKSYNDRVQVSEDGVKIMEKCAYDPTALHYDGQLGQTDDQQRRIQIVYTADKGPVRLFVVPGSNLPRVRQIIQRLTGVAGKPGFNTMKDSFKKHPELSKTLHEFGVSIPTTGLIMFCANVWHFEGYEGPNKVISDQIVKHIKIDNLRSKTSSSTVFRIYCGVVSVQQIDKKLIPLAYLRENGWCFDPFTRGNSAEELFVNSKSTQYWKITLKPSETQKKRFKELSQASLSEMKEFLARLSSRRLGLYGLCPNDVSGDNNLEESPLKKTKVSE